MTKPDYDVALDLLKQRDGMPTDVTLEDGRVVRVNNIAWGYDLGDPIAHITTNISRPNPLGEMPEDFFFANEIVRIVDPENGAVWFEKQDQQRRSRESM